MTDEKPIDETEVNPEADTQEFFKRRKLFEPMVATEAWKELEKISLAQCAGQFDIIMKPPIATSDGLAHMLRDNYHKGVVFGIKLMIATPHATILQAKEILSSLNRQQKDDTNGRRIDNTDDDGQQLPDSAIVTDLSGE